MARPRESRDTRGISSIGRASGWQPEGQGFESPILHFTPAGPSMAPAGSFEGSPSGRAVGWWPVPHARQAPSRARLPGERLGGGRSPMPGRLLRGLAFRASSWVVAGPALAPAGSSKGSPGVHSGYVLHRLRGGKSRRYAVLQIVADGRGGHRLLEHSPTPSPLLRKLPTRRYSKTECALAPTASEAHDDR